MKESEYAPIILETIGSEGASIRTLKSKCGQGNKISNIRKALFRLLKENKIEINGYDKQFNNFSYDGIMIKKVNPNLTNPIYVKGLLENPLENNNYLLIQQIFKKRIDLINEIYYKEIRTIENIMDKMPLKEAIKRDYIKGSDVYRKYKTYENNDKEGTLHKVTFNNVLDKHPETEIWYLSDSFSTSLALTMSTMDSKKFPNFTSKKFLKYDERDGERTFLDKYKDFFSHLPINGLEEKLLFKYFVINALKKNEDEILWELAYDLTARELFFLVDKFKIIDIISDNEFDKAQDMGFIV